MKNLSLGEDLFKWTGKSEILMNPYWKISLTSPAMVVEVINSTRSSGIVILGDVEAVVDTIVSTSRGAVGNTTIFNGTHLVILGLTVTDIQDSLLRTNFGEGESEKLRKSAQAMISKLQHRLRSSNSKVAIDTGRDCDYVIFGKRNFLLVAGQKKFVLIHRQQISVRSGESKLVQIDHDDGILIASKNKILNFGNSSSTGNLGGFLGELGLNITSTVLDHLVWD